MSASRKYEMVETYQTYIGMRFGWKPLVTVKEYRWRWCARISAFFNSFVGHFGISTTEVRIARPKLRVIEGGLSDLGDDKPESAVK